MLHFSRLQDRDITVRIIIDTDETPGKYYLRTQRQEQQQRQLEHMVTLGIDLQHLDKLSSATSSLYQLLWGLQQAKWLARGMLRTASYWPYLLEPVGSFLGWT